MAPLTPPMKEETAKATSLKRKLGTPMIAALARLAVADLGVETLAHIPYMLYGALIIAVLLIEPMGLGKLYSNVRNYLMVWPFGYARK